MTVFLCGSAFFSLSKHQVKKLRDAGQRLGRLVADLLLKPGDLLGALLLGIRGGKSQLVSIDRRTGQASALDYANLLIAVAFDGSSEGTAYVAGYENPE